MSESSFEAITGLLAARQETIVREWSEEVLRAWVPRYAGLVSEPVLRLQMSEFVAEIQKILTNHEGGELPAIPAESPLGAHIQELSASRAKLGFKTADTVRYVLGLKAVLIQHLMADAGDSAITASILAVNALLDQLGMLVTEAFIDTREKLIRQQSQSIQELSTPVVRLWDQVLLLPLIGVIDTQRARQFTESLLVAITRHEARVTVIDVTGVPVFDTSVARHIMKTIDAAKLLGSRIILTGISPEGALTMTKLNISFSGILCRTSLRAGIAEALQMIGQRIVSGVGT